MRRIWRIPAPVLVLACLAVAAVYVAVWPESSAVGMDGVRLVVLRWFHPLAWLLLAGACAAYGWRAPQRVTLVLAVLAGVSYVAFFAVVTTA